MISPALIRWLPLGAVMLHLLEEFVWPGGFADWYRWYRPERAGLFHLWATLRTQRYSPGVVTGATVYLPLAAFGSIYFWRAGLAGVLLLLQAAVIGPAYNVYAAWNHRRRAKSLA